MENRFKMLTKSHPDEAGRLFAQAQQDVTARRKLYESLVAHPATTVEAKPEPINSTGEK